MDSDSFDYLKFFSKMAANFKNCVISMIFMVVDVTTSLDSDPGKSAFFKSS